MPLRLREDLILLSFAGAALLFGGGLGCEPVLDGVGFRALSNLTIPDDKDSPRDFYMAFQGKKPPGTGWAALPFPLVPTHGVEARFGVFSLDPDVLTDSIDAEGCVRLERSDKVESYQLCARYVTGPAGIEVFSNVDTLDAFCQDDTKVFLEISDTAVTATLSYQCPGDSLLPLTTTPSLFTSGERWFAAVGAYNLQKGAEVGFDDFRITSVDPTPADPEEQVAFATFDAFQFGLEAFYELENDDDLNQAQFNSNVAVNALEFGVLSIENEISAFPDTNVEKFLNKAFKSQLKLQNALLDDKVSSYFKSFPKIADAEACALEESLPFY